MGFIGFLGIAERKVFLVNRRKDVILVISWEGMFLEKRRVISSKTQENNYFLRFFTLK